MKIKYFITIILSLLIFSVGVNGYYVNYYKFLEDSKKDDSNGGTGLIRETDEFIDEGCGLGTILDTFTGLCWDKNMNRFPGKNWSDSKNDCETLSINGYDDWRLPSSMEFLSILDSVSGNSKPFLATLGFTSAQTFYWTNSLLATAPTKAWSVRIDTGTYRNFQNSNTVGAWKTVCVRRSD